MTVVDLAPLLGRSDLAEDERPWLVSFPRTGSHWLRVALDSYYGGHPFIHTHDTRLARGREVVYLYRVDAVAVVHSLLTYRRATPSPALVTKTARAYARHQAYWLAYGRSKLVVTYEQMAHDLGRVVRDLGEFCGLDPVEYEFDPEPFDYARIQAHATEPRVVRLDRDEYEAERERFRSEYARIVTVAMRGWK